MINHPVLFLDFDGVLHPVGTPALSEDFKLIDNPELFCYLPILEQLLEPHPTVRIIVSSDWRRLFDDETLIRVLGKLGSRFEGVVECFGRVRAEEVRDEVMRRGLPRWIVLDDHDSVAQAAISDGRFIPTNPELGISDPLTQIAIKDALSRLTGTG